MRTMTFRSLVKIHLDRLNWHEQELASAAEVSQRQMSMWIQQGDERKLKREHVNRIAFAIAYAYDQIGDPSAIDQIEIILAELLFASGCSPLDLVA